MTTENIKPTKDNLQKEAKKDRQKDPTSRPSNKNLSKESKKSNSKNSKNHPSGKKSTNKNPRQDSKKKGKTPNVPDKTEKLKLQRQKNSELEQVFHTLGNDCFKVFRKGQYVTSYGFIVKGVLGKDLFKFTLNVPQDYPKSPLKLSNPNKNGLIKTNATQEDVTRNAQVSTLVENFNFKAREFNRISQPITMQLNYLMTQWERLSSPDFKSIDKLQKEFLKQFTN